MVHFQNGEFQGLVFDLDTSALANFPVTRLTMAGLDLDYIIGGLTFQVTADPAPTSNKLQLDFNGITPGPYTLIVDCTFGNDPVTQSSVNITAAATGESIRDLVLEELKDKGINVVPGTGAKLIIKGRGGKELKTVTISGVTGAGADIVPPKAQGFKGDITYNGLRLGG